MSEDLNTRDVVLLHGLGRTPASMMALAWRLKRAGFRAVRLGYPSTRLNVADAIAHVRTRISVPEQSVHLVGHSLGGLIAAALLREGRLPIARVVQIGAPNLGSPAADRLGGHWPVRKLCGPAVAELGAHDARPVEHPRIGAIAGINGPRLPTVNIAEPHDGVVDTISAWAGAGDRADVAGLHSLLPLSANAAKLVIAFLTHGRFEDTPE